MNYEVVDLKSRLPLILAPIPETPRMALAVTIDGGIRRETIPGMAKMAERLLSKGTKNRSAEALALELDERAIELRELTLPDCTILLAVFLNRELPSVLDIMKDIVFNSTFTDFEKEAVKLAGEIQATLDLPAEIAQDLLIRTQFAGHPYGNTGTRVLETLPQLDADSVRQWFMNGLDAREVNVTLVGDFSTAALTPQLEDAFASITASHTALPVADFTPIKEDCLVMQARPDAQQAQVYQGWYAQRIGSQEQAAMSVMNTILGAGGLSSRLFIELRDKQGLAYSVRSQFAPMRLAGQFLVTIGTSPENIERARKGFAEQISRMQNEPITLDELQNAKGRLRGSFMMAHETNSQHCLDLSISQINGLPPNYSTQLLERIEGVTITDVQTAAQSIKPPSVTAIVAREEALPKD